MAKLPAGPPLLPPRADWAPLLDRALAEDIGTGDVTSAAIFGPDAVAAAVLETREPAVVCGLEIAAAAFEAVEPAIRFRVACADGDSVPAGFDLARVEGPTRGLLAAERTALNFLSRLCGVATWTRRFVDAVAGTGTEIVDTRKTLPGWRVLDKYAVACGGGRNHRFGLYDAVMIKDNHVSAAGGIAAAVRAAKEAAPPGIEIHVEAESLADARVAADAGADLLMLDNRTPAELREIVAALGDSVRLEATGGVTLGNVREVAATGVARISIGALTHSAPAVDLALEVRPTPQGNA